MSKKPLNMGGLINPEATPADTGIPQRGAESDRVGASRSVKANPEERRGDMMSFKVKPSVRDRIKALAKDYDMQIAVVLEEAFDAYEKKLRSRKSAD
ncbi:hypothetical protein [Rubellimicrobium roseum]|uniref:Uncharacterized protein n=1 Tax=Rubellimicrobium roseum TaxID=687525 RepID=A0A5C4N6A2_9RHOB|nr:hypothetical protein [Rubellimicrobium roseum]TNC60299.1 hypothetical protein FHG71_22140 [Rubellimicrobium roseum]